MQAPKKNRTICSGAWLKVHKTFTGASFGRMRIREVLQDPAEQDSLVGMLAAPLSEFIREPSSCASGCNSAAVDSA